MRVPQKSNILTIMHLRSPAVLVLSLISLMSAVAPGEEEISKPPYVESHGMRCWNQELFTPWLRSAVGKLRAEGKLVSRDLLLKDPTPNSLPQPPAAVPVPTDPLPPPALAEKLRAATVVVMCLNEKGKNNYGSGFAVADDLVVTNWHVVGLHPELPDIVVVGHDAMVRPVVAVAAADRDNDLVVLRVCGPLVPLPVAATALPAGEHLWQMGHTHMALWSFTEGMAIRHCVESFVPDGAKESRSMVVMDVSNNISKGSSGSAVVNARGEVGGVYFRSRWYYQDEQNKITVGEESGNSLVLKDRYVLYERNMCVPLPCLRALLGWKEP